MWRLFDAIDINGIKYKNTIHQHKKLFQGVYPSNKGGYYWGK